MSVLVYESLMYSFALKKAHKSIVLRTLSTVESSTFILSLLKRFFDVDTYYHKSY